MMDADGQRRREIPRFVGALVTELTLQGSRFAAAGVARHHVSRIWQQILSGLVNSFFGTRYTDLCYGYNAFWQSTCPSRPECDGFEIEP